MHLARGNWLVVAGYFDPLTASVAERLENLVVQGRAEKVLAIVLDSPNTLLSAEARSVLIASLRIVSVASVMRESDLSRIPRTPRIRFVFDAETEKAESAEFAALVLGKERLVASGSESGS